MSAHDYWSDLAEAEQVGVPAEPAVVVRRVRDGYELFIDGKRLHRATESECWDAVREHRGLPRFAAGTCQDCGGKHYFAESCVNDGHVPRPRVKETKGEAA